MTNRLANRFAVCAGVFALAVAPLYAQPESTVGMPGKLEALVLPGTELEVVPLTDRKSPVVLRIIAVYPHGTIFSYDIEYSGFEPGRHDLRPYLQRKDGTSTADLPEIMVQVKPVLPPGHIEPNKLEIDPAPRLGGYRKLLIVLGVVWGIGFIAIVATFVFPRRKRTAVPTALPRTLADRLRPLVERAAAGNATQAELAGLERGLMAYWRRQLKLEAVEPAEAMSRLRNHAEAGPLLGQLEDWLHRPEPRSPVNVAKLLEPYRNLPPDAADLSVGGTP